MKSQQPKGELEEYLDIFRSPSGRAMLTRGGLGEGGLQRRSGAFTCLWTQPLLLPWKGFLWNNRGLTTLGFSLILDSRLCKASEVPKAAA